MDERIPFISKLRRYSSSMFKVEEIRKAESQILTTLGWNLQFCTLFDILEYYLSQGIVFSTDLWMSMPPANENNILKEKNFNHRPNIKSEDPLEKALVRSFSALGIGEVASGARSTLLSGLDASKVFEIVSKLEREALRLTNMITRGNISKINIYIYL